MREATGLPSLTFKGAVIEARRALSKARRQEQRQCPRPARPEVSVIKYTVNRDMVAQVNAQLVEAISPADRFYRSPTGLVFIHKGIGPTVLDERNLPGKLNAFVEIAFTRVTEDGPTFERYGPLTQELSRTLVHCPRFRSSLPLLRSYVRSPVFSTQWSLVSTFGWHADCGTFYDGTDIAPRAGTAALDAITRGFHWKGDADRVGFIGALLTMLTIPHWTRGHPFVVVNGNKPGVGKSTLARVLAAIIEGATPPTISYNTNDEEFEKQIATRVEAGDRVIIVDNAKSATGISSPVLERCVTDAQVSFRRLGSNTAITRAENDILFLLTANTTQLGPDLRRRALPLNLEVNGSVRNTTYAVDDPVGLALRTRTEVLGELAHMVSAWVTAGRPMPEDPARHSTGQAWAGTIDAILRFNDMPGFLSNFSESEHAFDPKYALMQDVVTQHYVFAGGHAKDWAPVLREGALREMLHDRTGRPRAERSQCTLIGNLFQQYVDEEIDSSVGKFTLTEERPCGQPFYKLERLVE